MGLTKMIDDHKIGGKWVRCGRNNGKPEKTLSYGRWWTIASRCDPEGSYQRNKPTYRGCTMSDNFKDFDFFADWFTTRVGYGLPNYHIDKDILLEANKEYHESICVLVPQKLNSFFANCGAVRGVFPQGVSLYKRDNVFQAYIDIDGKRVALGRHDTPEKAYSVYKKAKEAEARRWSERLIAGEYIVDQRVIERMQTWGLPEYE